jgi:hypothetical protein
MMLLARVSRNKMLNTSHITHHSYMSKTEERYSPACGGDDCVLIYEKSDE